MSLDKVLFYIVLLIINVLAFTFIGISFLSGPSSGGEGVPLVTPTRVFIKLSVYILIVSVIFSGLVFVLGYLFREKFTFTQKALKKLFLVEFLLFIVVYLATYCYIYLKA